MDKDEATPNTRWREAGRSRFLDRTAHDQYVTSILEQLAELERDSQPVTNDDAAPGKDRRARMALYLARELVDAVAGWAVDHTLGKAASGLTLLDLQPDQTKAHPDLLELLSRSDRHDHEIAGGALAEEVSIGAATARTFLISLARVGLGAVPESVSTMLAEALAALEFGETLPLLKPLKGGRKRQRSALRLQLRALEFVEFRVRLGMTKKAALEQVAHAYGVSFETIRSWEQRLRSKIGLGGLEVSRALAFARNVGDAAAEAQRNGGRLAFIEYDREGLARTVAEWRTVMAEST